MSLRLDILLKPGSLDYSGSHGEKAVVTGKKNKLAVFVHKKELQAAVIWLASASWRVKEVISKL